MRNISKFILTFFIAIPLVFAFGNQTKVQIDEVINNTGTDILLNPTDKVDIGYFAGEKALQSTVDGELEESAVTNTELGYVSGVTSGIQGQLDSKAPNARLLNTTTPLQGGGDLSADRTLSILQSSAVQDGYLSSANWNTFNNKQDAITGTDGDLYYYNSGLSNLSIGANGQILQVSALGFPEWADLPPSVSVTTKGDIQTYSTTPDRLPVGTNGQILSANSATSTGLEWIDPDFYTSPLTTQGDLLYRDATQDTRLTIGSEGQLLTVISGEPSWQDAPVTLPDQSGNSGLYLKTNGTTASWNELNNDVNEIKDNLLECSGFDGCVPEGVITNGAGIDFSGTTTRTVEATAFNTSKLNLNQSAAGTLDYTYTKTASFDGKQMVAYCEIKTSNTQVTFSVGADGVEAGSLDVSSDNSWKYYKIPFVGGATSQYFKIDHVNAGETPNIDVDNCFIGKTQDATFKLDTTIGDWKDVTLASSWVAGVSSFTSKMKRVGDSAYFDITMVLSGTPTSTSLSFSLPSGMAIDENKLSSTSTTAYDLGLASLFENGVQNRPSFVRYLGTTSVGLVYLTNTTGLFGNVTQAAPFTWGAGDEVHVQFSVPIVGWSIEKSTVVTQDNTSDPEKAGFVYFSMSEMIENDTWQRADGECLLKTKYPDYVRNVSSAVDCTITTANDGFLLPDLETNNRFIRTASGSLPVGTLQADDFKSHSHGSSSLYNVINSTVFETGTGNAPLVAASGARHKYNSMLTVGGTETRPVNIAMYAYVRVKDNKNLIVGKFENINSSDLRQVVVEQTASFTSVATPYDVIFSNEIKDDFNIYNNSTGIITPDITSLYDIDAQVQAAFGGSLSSIQLYNITDSIGYAPNPETATDFHRLNGTFLLESGKQYTIRLSNWSGTGTLTSVSNTSVRHRLSIVQNPNYEAIVKNLSNQKTKCQTKYLTANATASGTLSDLTFNNLDTSKYYSVTGQASFVYGEGNTCRLDVSAGVQIFRLWQRQGTSAGAQRDVNASTNPFFKPTATTLTGVFTEDSACTIEGNGTYATTYITLCELPDTYVPTTEF